MKNSTFLFALLSSLIATNATAQDSGVSETGIRYNQIGAGYVRATPSDDSALSGYAVNGSVLINKDIYVTGYYSAVSKTGTNIDRYGLSAGYRIGIASNVDFFAEAGFIKADMKTSDGKGGSTGFDVAAGVNATLTPDVQGSLRISYPRYSSADFSTFNKVTFGANATYFITKEIGASVNFSHSSQARTMGAGLTYAF